MITKFKTATDFRKSLENRLKNVASQTGNDLQRLRRNVAFDRLLARLLDEDDTSFALKGGYAMELRFSNARATKDIDLTFQHRLEKEKGLIKDVILEELKNLSLKDLGDFFAYQIGDVQIDLENAPYGGARYPVSSYIDGKLFVRFQLDVGGDAIVSETEMIKGKDWLGFCGIPAPFLKLISIEQQFAEKLHAYSLPREDRKNTRVKDLIDMFLLADIRTLDLSRLKTSLEQVFKIRKTHKIPHTLERPPAEWERPYLVLANECDLSTSIYDAFLEVVNIHKQIIKKIFIDNL